MQCSHDRIIQQPFRYQVIHPQIESEMMDNHEENGQAADGVDKVITFFILTHTLNRK